MSENLLCNIKSFNYFIYLMIDKIKLFFYEKNKNNGFFIELSWANKNKVLFKMINLVQIIIKLVETVPISSFQIVSNKKYF